MADHSLRYQPSRVFWSHQAKCALPIDALFESWHSSFFPAKTEGQMVMQATTVYHRVAALQAKRRNAPSPVFGRSKVDTCVTKQEEEIAEDEEDFRV
mmetsp:Transcript_35921/g.81076  ORF Transcript_35921/g.81076 Transcript_35921/m.81076 type:complete len:97 (-) Transcript_35921:45-335(-)